MRKKLLFVYNALAGKGQIKAYLCDIIDVFTKNGYDVTAYPTQARLDGFEKIKAEAHRYDMVVVSGGDGTLSEAIKGLMGVPRKVPLGYIPAGTTNDFAASLEIPRGMLSAAEDIVNGLQFAYDVGEFNGEFFSYVAAFGAFTEVAYQTSQGYKNVFGHAAYILEGLKSIPKIEAHVVTVEHDSERFQGEFILGLITNTISIGGMKKLAKSGVVFDDGLFEVTLIRMPNNPIELQSILTKVVLSDTDSKYFCTFKTSRVKFTSDNEISWTLDGENGGKWCEVEIINHKQAVNLMIKNDEQEKLPLLN
ncbi:MAG: YegS/Rv2252/BmrU family lipid kinase [Oscillospiraceae bacterium]